MTDRLKDVNLLIPKGSGKKPLGRFFRWILTYGRYIIVLTELLVLAAFFSRFKFDRELTDLHELTTQKEAILKTALGFENEIRSLQDRVNDIKNLETRNLFISQLLTKLKELTPTGTKLKQVNLSKNILLLTGESETARSFTSFLYSLKKEKSFAYLSLDEIRKTDLPTGVAFKVSISLKE